MTQERMLEMLVGTVSALKRAWSVGRARGGASGITGGEIISGFLWSLPAALTTFVGAGLLAMASMGARLTGIGEMAAKCYLVLATVTFALCCLRRFSLAICNAIVSVGWMVFFAKLG